MTRIKHIVAMLALIGSFGAALASEAAQTNELNGVQRTALTSVDFQKDNIQFMDDSTLASVNGTMKIDLSHLFCQLQYAVKKKNHRTQCSRGL